MISYLISHNHTYENIIDGYPVVIVHNLMKAAREQDKMEHLQKVTGLTVATCHALDLAFNRGKGKVLSTYMKEINEKSVVVKEKGKKLIVGEAVMGLFNSLPRKV